MKDPVCGMEVEPRVAEGSSYQQGETYYFTNVTCKALFDRDPGSTWALRQRTGTPRRERPRRKASGHGSSGVSAAGEMRVPANLSPRHVVRL